MGLLTWWFVGLLLTFPLGVVVRIQVVPQAYVYPIDVFVIITVLYSLYAVLVAKKSVLSKSPLYIFAGVALISLLLNIFWLNAHEFMVSLSYLLRFILYSWMAMAVSLVAKKKREYIVLALVLSGILTVFLGLMQYFLYPDLRNLYYAGWDEHLYRLFSTFLDPNFASAIFVMTFWLLVVLFRNSLQSKWLATVYGSALLATFVALLLTYSRTGFVMFIASFLIFAWQQKQKKIILLAMIVFIVGVVLLPKNLKSEGVNLLRTASIESRLQTYKNAIKVWQSSPIWGVGFNSYRYAQIREGLLKVEPQTTHSGAGVSNSYLFVLATTGVIGLGVFLYYFYFLAQKIRRFTKKNKILGQSIGAILAAVLVGSLFDNIFFYPFVMVIFFSLLGLLPITDDTKP